MASSFSQDKLAALQRTYDDAWWLVVASGYNVSRNALAVIVMALATDDETDLIDTYDLSWEAFTKATSIESVKAA